MNEHDPYEPNHDLPPWHNESAESIRKRKKLEDMRNSTKPTPLPVGIYAKKVKVLEEATSLIDGDRQKQYGSSLEQYTMLAQVWSALLGIEITAEKAALLLAAMKVVRINRQMPTATEGLTAEEKLKHRDSVVDLAGYAGLIGKIEEERGWW